MMRLKVLLWVSGVLAALAVAVPPLIPMGLIAGILPGLMLVVAPTFFVYLATFAQFRKRLPLTPGILLNCLAAAITLAIGFALAAPFNNAGRQAFAAANTGEVTPAAPVAIAGDIRLERDANVFGHSAPMDGIWKCDALCAALLDMPAVRSITLAGTDRAGAPIKDATFRLVPKTDAPSGGVAPSSPQDIFTWLPEYKAGHDDYRAQQAAMEARRNALVAKWAMRLSTEKTLLTGPATGDADLTIAMINTRETGLHRLSVSKVEIRNRAGEVLLRRQRVSAEPIAVPLYFLPQGAWLDKGFGISRSSLHSGPANSIIKPIEILFSETTLNAPELAPGGLANLHGRFAAALGQPGRSPDLDLVSAWVATLDWRSLDRADIDLLGRAIRDPRITALERIYHSDEKAVTPRLREPIIARLLDPATPQPLRWRLNSLVQAMPSGTFAVLTEDERALLGNPQLRRETTALIERLADGGAAVTPQLVEILKADVFKTGVYSIDRDRVLAALCRAFTRLGPDASAALPEVDNLLSHSRSLNNDWRVAMVRMGKPVEELRFPPNFNEKQVEESRDIVRRMVAKVEAGKK